MSKWCNYQLSQLPDASSGPVQLWVALSVGLPHLGPTKGERALLQPSETSIPPHLAKHMAPDNKQGVSRSVEIHSVLMNADGPPGKAERLPALLAAQL